MLEERYEYDERPVIEVNYKALPHQIQALTSQKRRIFLGGGLGVGKCLRAKELVLCEDGFHLLSDLVVGDKIYTANGTLTTVIGRYPQGILNLWEILLDNGISTLSSRDHLWYCKYENESTVICTTEKIKQLMETEDMYIPLLANARTTGELDWHKIVRVMQTDKHEDCLCIKVDDPSGLFVIDNYVVTHNTETGSLWTLKQAMQTPKDVYGLISANTYRQLADSTVRNLYKNLKLWGIPHRPEKIPAAPRPFTIEIWNGKHFISVLCRSLDNYEMLSGIELGWFWLDEVFQTEKAAVELVFARDRDTRMELNQGLLTTTLDDPSSWMHEMFVTNYDDDLMEVIYAPTEVNRENLPEGYIEGLKKTYDPRNFARMVEAKWITLSAGRIYHAFDKDKHVSDDAEFNPALPILWAHDFNIAVNAPISSCLCQIKRSIGPLGWRNELIVFDEIVLDSADTNDVIKEMDSRRWKYKLVDQSQVYIFGDASGRSRDTRSKSSDYDILAQAGFYNQRVPNINPPIRTRHNEVNALLKNALGDTRLFIHPRCKTLISGLDTVQLKDGSHYIEKETRSQHITTSLGYLICEAMPSSTPKSGSTNLPV